MPNTSNARELFDDEPAPDCDPIAIWTDVVDRFVRRPDGADRDQVLRYRIEYPNGTYYETECWPRDMARWQALGLVKGLPRGALDQLQNAVSVAGARADAALAKLRAA